MIKLIHSIIIIYLKIVPIYSGNVEKSGKIVDENSRKEKSPMDEILPKWGSIINSEQLRAIQNREFSHYLESQREKLRQKGSAKMNGLKYLQHFTDQNEKPLEKKRPRESEDQQQTLEQKRLKGKSPYIISWQQAKGFAVPILDSGPVQSAGHIGSQQPFTITAGVNNQNIGLNFGEQNIVAAQFPLHNSKHPKEEMKQKQQFFHALSQKQKQEEMEKVLHKLIQNTPQQNYQHPFEIESEKHYQQPQSAQIPIPAHDLAKMAQKLLASNESDELLLPKGHSNSHQPSQQQQLWNGKEKAPLESEANIPEAHSLLHQFVPYQEYHPQFESLPPNSFSQNEIEEQQMLSKLVQRKKQIQQMYQQHQQQTAAGFSRGEETNWQQLPHLMGGRGINQQIHHNSHFIAGNPNAVAHSVGSAIGHINPNSSGSGLNEFIVERSFELTKLNEKLIEINAEITNLQNKREKTVQDSQEMEMLKKRKEKMEKLQIIFYDEISNLKY